MPWAIRNIAAAPVRTTGRLPVLLHAGDESGLDRTGDRRNEAEFATRFWL